MPTPEINLNINMHTPETYGTDSLYNDGVYQINSINDAEDYLNTGADPVLSLWELFESDYEIEDWWDIFIDKISKLLKGKKYESFNSILDEFPDDEYIKVTIAIDYLTVNNDINIQTIDNVTVLVPKDLHEEGHRTIGDIKESLIENKVLKESDIIIYETRKEKKKDIEGEYDIPTGIPGL